MPGLQIIIFILRMSGSFGQYSYFSVFSKKWKVLLFAYVKYTLHSHCAPSCMFLYLLEAKNSCFVTESCSKSYFFCSKTSKTNSRKTSITSEWLVGESYWTPRWIDFNAISISIKYTLSFQWSNFDLKCLDLCCYHNDKKSYLLYIMYYIIISSILN